MPLGCELGGAGTKLPAGERLGGICLRVRCLTIADQGTTIVTSLVLLSTPAAATATAAVPDGRSAGIRMTASTGDLDTIWARLPSTATKLLPMDRGEEGPPAAVSSPKFVPWMRTVDPGVNALPSDGSTETA